MRSMSSDDTDSTPLLRLDFGFMAPLVQRPTVHRRINANAATPSPSSPPPIQALEGRLQRGPSGARPKTVDSLPALAAGAKMRFEQLVERARQLAHTFAGRVIGGRGALAGVVRHDNLDDA